MPYHNANHLKHPSQPRLSHCLCARESLIVVFVCEITTIIVHPRDTVLPIAACRTKAGGSHVETSFHALIL